MWRCRLAEHGVRGYRSEGRGSELPQNGRGGSEVHVADGGEAESRQDCEAEEMTISDLMWFVSFFIVGRIVGARLHKQ